MTHEEFNRIIRAKIEKCLETLVEKSRYYAINDDRLAQFKRIASKLNMNPCEVIRVLAAKHETALDDYTLFINSDTNSISWNEWEEKIGDSINYLLLLYATAAEIYSEITENDLVAYQTSSKT